MEVVLFLLPFVLLGIAVVFIAFSGGPGPAREGYLTRGNRVFRLGIPVLYLILGGVVPAIVIAKRSGAEGGKGKQRTTPLTPALERGKEAFRQSCATCHDLDAVNARGVTGPDLDDLGQVDTQRVLNAIRKGGTGQGRMPARLLEGRDAQDVAAYVAKVAGK